MTPDPSTHIDHVLIGAASLDEGIEWLEERTGIRAAVGGSHPGLGTWNALASLGGHAYLEVIAPDPQQPGIDTFYVPGLRDYREPRVATWALRVRSLDTVVRRASSDMRCDAPRPGSRVRPDGTRLSWKLAFPSHLEHGRFDGALPFLIEWEEMETHPGLSAARGLSLLALSVRHPHGDALRACIESFGPRNDAVRIAPSSDIGLTVEVASPRGIVLL